MPELEKTPVYHKKCDTQVGWWLGPCIKGEIIKSQSFTDMKGEHPVAGSLPQIWCEKCQGNTHNFMALRRGNE